MLYSLPIAVTLFFAVAPDAGNDQLVVSEVEVALVEQRSVPAREAGVLIELSVKEGDSVVKGNRVGQIDDRLARVARRLAETELRIAEFQSENDIDLRYAQKTLDVSSSELQRSLGAVAIYPNSISQTELDRLQLVKEQSKLSLERAERDKTVATLNVELGKDRLTSAELGIERRAIDAPIDGTVVEVFKRPGEWLTPGEPVVRIIRNDLMRVKAFVDGKRYGRELAGKAVRFTAKLPPGDRVEEFLGKVVFVNPELQPVTQAMMIWADIDNPAGLLRPGDLGVLKIQLK